MSLTKRILILALLCGMLVSAGCLAQREAPVPAPVPASKTADISYSGEAWQESAYPTPVPTFLPTTAPGEPTGGPASEDKIIRTASVALEVRNISVAMDSIEEVAASRGGYPGLIDITRGISGRVSATTTLRVPADRFDEALAAILSLGEVRSQSVRAEDVTEEWVDLNAKREAYGHQLLQYNKILEKAESVEDILKVQTQIERVQVEIDRLDGRMQYLKNRVALGTITVRLEEPQPIGAGQDIPVISVLNEGLSGMFGVLSATVIIVITLLPLVLIALAVYAVYRWRKKKES